MTMDCEKFLLTYRIDKPAKEGLTFALALGKDGESAVQTLARIGLERLRLLGPLTGPVGNVFVIDPYEGTVGTVDAALRQPLLFEDALERFSAEMIEAGLRTLLNLPSKDDKVQSLEELEASGAAAYWNVAVGLAKVAEAQPGLEFRCNGRDFTLPGRLSESQTEFVSEQIVPMAKCFVVDASKEAFVRLACLDAKAGSWQLDFRAFIARDNPARRQLELACALHLPADVVHARRVRSLSHAQVCALVESVEVDVARFHRALDARLAGRIEPDS